MCFIRRCPIYLGGGGEELKKMRGYCQNGGCEEAHCLYGKDGSKRMHVTDCNQKHCYGCFKHNAIKIGADGFVESWYCDKCRPEVAPQKIGGRYTIPDIQEKIRDMVTKMRLQGKDRLNV